MDYSKLSENEKLDLVLDHLHNISTMRRDIFKRFVDPRRNIDDECGFPQQIRIQDYQDMYDREAVAARAVEFMARECWKVTPEICEDLEEGTETAFEEAWRDMLQRVQGEDNYFEDADGSSLYAALEELDVASGIAQYAVALLGFNDGKELSEPVAGIVEENTFDQKAELTKTGKVKLGKKPDYSKDQVYNLTVNADSEEVPEDGLALDYIRVFTQVNARITAFEANRSSPRYGLPTKYHLTYDDTAVLDDSFGRTRYSEEVHWSRILHVPSDGGVSSSKVFGMSRLQQIFNDLLGERKISGGSPEGYWKMCFTSLVFETAANLGGSPKINKQQLKETIQDFQNGLQKFMLATGLSAKSIAPTVVDPTPHHNLMIERICVNRGWPVRLFKGSERGELSSEQDTIEWNTRVNGRRNRRCTPAILAPLANRLILVGALPEPEQLYAIWPDTTVSTPQAQATLATTRQDAIGKFVDKGSHVMTPQDFLTRELNYSDEEAEAILDALEKMQDEADQAQALLDSANDDEVPNEKTDKASEEQDESEEDLPTAEEEVDADAEAA